MELDAMATRKRTHHEPDRLEHAISESTAEAYAVGDQRASLLAAELLRLNDDLLKITAERDHLADQIRQISKLLGNDNPDKLIHNLRNVLNELNLLRIITKDMD